MNKPKRKSKKRTKKISRYVGIKGTPIKVPHVQVTKVLDTTTVRKHGLVNLYQIVVDTQQLIVGIDEEQRKAIFRHMLTVAKKLAKVADAVDDYEEAESREITRFIIQSKQIGEVVAEDSTRLDQKAEEVLSQAKSTLDVLVKVLKPLWNIYLQTYSKSGGGIVKALHNNVPEEFRPKVQNLIDLVEGDKEWIDAFKTYRDDQHYGNLGISVIRADPDGNYELARMPDGTLVREYISVLYENLFSFVMDFMVLAIYTRMPGEVFTFTANGEGSDRIYKIAINTSKLTPVGDTIQSN